TLRASTYLNQPRISINVKQATPNGTIPISKFLPSHGRAKISRWAILLNPPLLKIQPACSPIDNQSERVTTRASARIQPIRNKVAKLAATIVGLENCENE